MSTANGEKNETSEVAISECNHDNQKEETEEVGPYDFDLDRLKTSFETCIQEDGKILLKNYIDGYVELYKFLNLLGTVFGWVSMDVDAKIDVLRKHRKAENAAHYQNVQDMVKFEVDNNMIKPKARDSSTGSRNLLRLHRALEYIIMFLKGVSDLEADAKCCPLSQDAYNKSLKNFHRWVVQKGALLAMHMLPVKRGLLEKVSGGQFESEEYKRAEELLPHGVKVMQEVYDKTNEIYVQFDILNLP